VNGRQLPSLNIGSMSLSETLSPHSLCFSGRLYENAKQVSIRKTTHSGNLVSLLKLAKISPPAYIISFDNQIRLR